MSRFASIHWTHSGRRPVERNSRCMRHLRAGSSTTSTIREGPSLRAARMFRSRMGSEPTRASPDSHSFFPAVCSGRRMATVNSDSGVTRNREFRCLSASFSLMSSIVPHSSAFPRRLDLVKMKRHVPPTAVQKNARSRLARAKVNPVAALRSKILPINTFPPSNVPKFPGLRLPTTFTSLVIASMTRALNAPNFTPMSQRTKQTSMIAMQ